MITAQHLSKRFGGKLAVDDVSFDVRPGLVTGFLGPNGAGKSTTMRMIVGLDRPTAGTVTVAGRAYATHAAPLAEVGVLLDAKAAHPGRTARGHLRVLAATHGIPASRVERVLELTGLQSVSGKRIRGFSLGMSQRLGIAGALLGDPRVLIFDEPVNGLDPEGVRWIRSFVRGLAAEGRTVLLSSHLMSEMAQTADHVIVLGRGRVLADAPISNFIQGASEESVKVRSSDATALASAIAGDGVTVTRHDGDVLVVAGLPAARIAEISSASGLALHELTPQQASLEDAYLALTGDAVEYATEAAR